jgi:hypothetical protein
MTSWRLQRSKKPTFDCYETRAFLRPIQVKYYCKKIHAGRSVYNTRVTLLDQPSANETSNYDSNRRPVCLSVCQAACYRFSPCLLRRAYRSSQDAREALGQAWVRRTVNKWREWDTQLLYLRSCSLELEEETWWREHEDQCETVPRRERERERKRETFGTGRSSTAPVRRPPLTEYRQWWWWWGKFSRAMVGNKSMGRKQVDLLTKLTLYRMRWQ